MYDNKKKIRLSFNSPVILSFSIICLIALILGSITQGRTDALVFSVYRSSLMNPLTYVRFVGHVFGHANWEHFIGNITLLLVVGPMLEEKYGSLDILFVILSTAIVTGIANFVFFPRVQLMGASGVVFAFIMMSSFTSIEDRTIPVTFIVVALIYIGGQVYDGIFVKDDVSNLTHILGGGVGSGLGYIMSKNKRKRYQREYL